MELPHENCPICEKALKYSFDGEESHHRCENKCYTLSYDIWETEVSLFEGKNILDKFNLLKSHENYNFYNDKVKDLFKRIEYWKKDYRYLAEILERS